MNYNATARTNYFQVTDEKRYQQLMNGISAESPIEDFTKTENGNTIHGFGANDSISFYKIPSMIDKMKPYIDNDECYEKNGVKISELVFDDIDTYEEIYDKDGNIIYDRYSQNDDFDEFIKELQKILPDNECFVYMESGHTGLRSISGYIYVATKDKIRFMSMSKFVNSTVKELLGEDATTEYTY